MLDLWVKAGHIIFVVAWMAGLMILPRYRLHQLSSEAGAPLFETMKSASAKLRRIILTPALILVWGLGLTLIARNPDLLSVASMQAKIVLVIGLTGFHGYMISLGRKVDMGVSSISTKRLKLLNELPFILMIAIVILVVVKPF
jgi:putative membrane protein